MRLARTGFSFVWRTHITHTARCLSARPAHGHKAGPVPKRAGTKRTKSARKAGPVPKRAGIRRTGTKRTSTRRTTTHACSASAWLRRAGHALPRKAMPVAAAGAHIARPRTSARLKRTAREAVAGARNANAGGGPAAQVGTGPARVACVCVLWNASRLGPGKRVVCVRACFAMRLHESVCHFWFAAAVGTRGV